MKTIPYQESDMAYPGLAYLLLLLGTGAGYGAGARADVGLGARAGAGGGEKAEDDCKKSNIDMEISDRSVILEKLTLPRSKEVYVVDSREDVKVECRAETSLRLGVDVKDRRLRAALVADPEDGISKSSNNSQVVKKRAKVLWKKNETNFWSRKSVTCWNQFGSCTLNLTLANKPHADTNCTVGETITCRIRAWYQEVQSNRSGGRCEKEKPDRTNQLPTYKFSFYNHETKNWSECNKTGVGREKSFDNVSQIVCDAMGTKIEESDKLIIRLSKTYNKKHDLLGGFKPDCEESTYLAVSGDFFVMANNDEADETTLFIIIACVLALIVLVAIVSFTVFLRRHRSASPAIVYDAKSASYQRAGQQAHHGPSLEDEDGDDDGSAAHVSIPLQHKADKEAIAIEEGVKNQHFFDQILGASHSVLNPGMLINKQTNALNYDESLEVPRDSFHLDFIIGEGQYGTVYRATATGLRGQVQPCKVAVKQVKNLMDDTQWRTIVDELKILSYLDKHFNLVNIVGANTASINRREIFLLLEFCPFGDMKSFVVEKREAFLGFINNSPGHLESEFNWDLLLTWSYSVACGMEYLNKKKIMHGDLAARNILIGENFSAKISDFGLSKMMYYNEDYKKTERRMIPWAWMAIEYLQTAQFNLMSDVWSFGVTLWEIFSLGNKPYGLQSYEYTKLRIVAGERLELPGPLGIHPQGDQIFKQVMHSCWAEAPADRPTFSQLRELLAQFMGEEALRVYRREEEKYLNLSPGGQPSPTSAEKPAARAPTGYIRIESMDGSQQTESAASGTSDAGSLLQGTAAVAGNCESGRSLQAYAAAGGSEISSGDSVQTEQEYLEPLQSNKFAYVELQAEPKEENLPVKAELTGLAVSGYSTVGLNNQT